MADWTPYASLADYEVCRQLHRQFGTSYYMASRFYPKPIRMSVDALYGFVRVPDEWVDKPGHSIAEQGQLIEDWRHQVAAGLAGSAPNHPVLRAFLDTMRQCAIPESEANVFLDAMDMDRTKQEYATWDDLVEYMRGSATAVGYMMCSVMGVTLSDETQEQAKALSEAMQLTNFIRDIREDGTLGRVYIPQEDLCRFGLTSEQLLRGGITDNVRELIQFEIKRCRELYAKADPGIDKLGPLMTPAVRAARMLYADILTEIERRDYDVFTARARVSKPQRVKRALQAGLLRLAWR